MQKLAALALVFLALFATGCAFPGVYKIPVQQGNILGQKELGQLKTGMTRHEVHFVLGTPSMPGLLNQNIETYLYTFQKDGGEISKQRVTVYYDKDLMQRVESQMLPSTTAY